MEPAMSISPDNDPLLSTREIAADSGLSASFFEKARLTGEGPEFIRLGRAVRYRRSVYRAWKDARPVFRTTAEARVQARA
jgi:predicted DNA-binding transcriptional regulator AlpA